MKRVRAGASPRALALTQGDPSGIGPEIALKAWLARGEFDWPFFLIADPAHIEAVVARLGLAVPVENVAPEQAVESFPRALPVVPLANRVEGRPGSPSVGDAAATLESIERAVALTRHGEAAGVVTNPIAKEVLYKAGFRHPGHTEFLGELALRDFGLHVRPVMMLWSPLLAVVPVTIYIALSRVPTELTRALIVETATIVAHDMERHFGIARPRLAVSGLNPHAGEGGSMGREEIDVIAPALAELRGKGIDVSGPHSADTLFHAAARAKYDVAICMYHDQALIPIKTLAFDTGVNVTLGLPFIRTSPDHGTAFDIAERGIANPSSLIAALQLAGRLAGRAARDEVVTHQAVGLEA